MKGLQLVLPALVGLSAIAAAWAEEDSNAGTLQVGVILPLTAGAAPFGTSVKNGMLLAYRSLSPEDQKRLKFYFEDDAFNPRLSVSAYQKLKATYDIDVLINAGSQTGKALSTLAEGAHIPFLAIASDQEVVAGKKYVMNFWVTPGTEAKILLPEALKRGYQRIAVISTVHDFAFAVRKAFDDVNQKRIEIVLDQEYLPDIKDFRTFVAKLRTAQKVDAVLALLMPGQLGIFAKQLRQQGVSLPIFGFEFFEDPLEVQVSEGALIGQWYVNAAGASPAFNESYLREFPGASLFAASNGYDLVLLLAAISKQARSRDEINQALHNLSNFSGAMGTYSATSANGFTLPAAIKRVSAAGFEELPVMLNLPAN
jgi:branched-chain amino acid transport system substrate-binding protein